MGSNVQIFAATRENFDQLVVQNSRRGLVLVDFWSPKAGPSLRQRQMLTRLTGQLGGRVLLATVNTDEQKQPARDDPRIAQLSAHLDFLVNAAAVAEPQRLEDWLAQQPDDHQTRYRLASELLVQDNYEGAMEQLMTLLRTAPDFRNGVARKGLSALFNMIDTGAERVRRFRAELSNLSP